MKRVMLDLETMSMKPNAAIVAIGACVFNLELGVTDTFYRAVTLESSVEMGGVIDPSTVTWWLDKPKEAQEALLKDPVPLWVALGDFREWLGEVDEVWGNGSDFDNLILRTAYENWDADSPWSHRANRCYRTVCSMAPDVKLERCGTHHNALDDATSQAVHLIRILWRN